MCGVAGIVDLEATRDIDRDALQRMTDALRHRGPDGEGVFIAPGVGFSHRRLAIIDRKGGAQPFHVASRKGVLTYNGEIYNYLSLAQDLAAQGVALSTRSDAETLAEGLALHGPAFVAETRGMFAFGYWNITSETLLLCRDRLGEKPLYYAITDDNFLIFASEIGALAASGLAPLDLDPQALADYFLYGFVPDPKSVYKAIRKLPPATMLIAERGAQPRLETYWRASFEIPERVYFEEARDELLPLLDEAVRLQMLADVPLGAFLSGGVDSSAIVASMAQTGGRIKTCAIGFMEESHDERPFARAVAAAYGAEHAEEVASLDAVALIDEIARVYGEPFADSSALPTYLVSQLTRQHVAVALSGDGSDEIFAGYRRYPFFLREETLRSAAPQSLRKPVFSALGGAYPKLDWAPQPLRMKTTFEALARNSANAYAHAMAANLPDRMQRMLSPELKRVLAGYEPESVVQAVMNADAHPLLKAQQVDLATWLPGRMLTKLDRASMAHSLEARAPFLDHKLVEWASELPPAFKLFEGNGKRILKSALEERLPEEILYRPKQGFALPLADWLRDENGPLARLSVSSAWRDSGVLDEKSVLRLADEHKRGRSDCSQELWTVLMFDAFLMNAARRGQAV
ncbi:MAG: asparagine synthase (glutamine-hydrolyzing) [Pseudomonadota bacterium]|nr:asparagine synthase (glutamine-hydrolyzing) [Pseudomonadota bacterium]